MTDWAKGSMREAINLLASMGRGGIASDLSRVLGAVDFENLQVLRSPLLDQIASEIHEASSVPQLAELLSRLACALGVAHATLHVIGEGPCTNFSTKVLTTYPAEWIMRYLDRRYFLIDPVGRACVSADKPFFWHSLERTAPVLCSFWTDASAYDVGPSGYTQPLTTERGDLIAISICASEDEAPFRERILQHQSDLLSLGILLSDAFSRLASEQRPASFNPSDDQLIILCAIAMGADETELEQRRYQHGSFATLKPSICSLFHTKTLAQAAVIAARIGILAEAPLHQADILQASRRSIPGTAPDRACRGRLAQSQQ